MAAPPPVIEWSKLSGRSLEIVAHIAIRISAGFTLSEVAAVLNFERPELKHLRLPARVSKLWVASRMRELRDELEAAAES